VAVAPHARRRRLVVGGLLRALAADTDGSQPMVRLRWRMSLSLRRIACKFAHCLLGWFGAGLGLVWGRAAAPRRRRRGLRAPLWPLSPRSWASTQAYSRRCVARPAGVWRASGPRWRPAAKRLRSASARTTRRFRTTRRKTWADHFDRRGRRASQSHAQPTTRRW